jgi:putative ABC transport system permease protein
MVVARLRPGVTIEQADGEMRAIATNLAREYPNTNEKVGAFVAPMRDHFVDSRRGMLTVLLGTVAFVLLIACSNLANLLLCRAANRAKEVAVRTALGSGVWPLMRQFFCESLVLCLAGAVLGLLLANLASGFLALLAPSDLTGLNSLEIDWRVLIFTLTITVFTAVVFGLVPLAQVRRVDVSHSLKQTARSLAGATTSRRFRAALICSQVALAFVLLIGAGLLIQSLARLRSVDTGFRTSNILALYLPPSEARRTPATNAVWQQEVLRRVTALPGVVSAGFTNHIPLVVKGDITGVGAEGRDLKIRTQCRLRVAGPGYLRTLGIPVLLGRDIDERDIDGALQVVLVNQTLAGALWPGQNPVGRRIHFRDDVYATVIGVTRDIRQAGLDVAPQPEFYASALQVAPAVQALAIHTSADPMSLAGAVRRSIWSFDPDQAIMRLASMEQILDREVFQRRVQTTLLAVFAGLALLLAAIGLYGVLAYLVGQQIPEIGLRLALGAEPADVLKRIVGHGLKLTLIGLAAGAAASLVASRLLTGMVYGVATTDPVTYAAVAAVLLVTALASSYVPARRAMSIDPISALREE